MTRRSVSALLVLLMFSCERATVSLATRKPDAGGGRDASAQQDESEDEDQEDEHEEHEEDCELWSGEDC